MVCMYGFGQLFMYPRNELSYRASVMRMMFSKTCEEYRFSDVFVRALDRIQILHVDQAQHASNLRMRLAGRSGGHPVA